MDEEYDEATARHYAAYRPPLHERILQPVLGRLPRFGAALDIGCGVGHSTIALTDFAEDVVGADPARHMVNAATELWGSRALFVCGAMPPFLGTFQQERFDLFTLAGVLSYLDPEETLDGIFSLANREAKVVTYDFDVALKGLYEQLGYHPALSGYRHDVELPENERYGFKRQFRIKRQLKFTTTSSELAHLLLSVKDFRLWAEKKFGVKKTYSELVTVLGDDAHTLTAKTWCSLFAFQG